MTTIFIIFSFLVAAYFIYFQYNKYQKFPTLRATIYFEKPNKYICKFEELHSENLESEHSKLVLHFVAKILNVVNDKKENLVINLFLKQIERDGISIALNSFNSLIFISEGISNSAEKLSATLRYENAYSRMILCKIPMNYYSGKNHLFYSLVALIQLTFDKLSIDQKEILEDSIKFMVGKYNEGANPKSFKTMHQLPNLAFIESI